MEFQGGNPLLPFTVTKPVTIQEMSIAPNAHDTKVDSGMELTNSNLFSVALRGSNLALYCRRDSPIGPGQGEGPVWNMFWLV